MFSLKLNLTIGQFHVTIQLTLPNPKWNVIFERSLISRYVSILPYIIHVAQTLICLILWSLYFKERNFTSCFVMRYTFLIILFAFTEISNSNGKRRERKDKMHHKKSKVEAVWPSSSTQWTSFSKKLFYWKKRGFATNIINLKCRRCLPLGN